MKYKEFIAWCNDRACDGCWGMEDSIYCLEIVKQVESKPFWKREKKWQELNAGDIIEKSMVMPINHKIVEIFGEDRQ